MRRRDFKFEKRVVDVVWACQREGVKQRVANRLGLVLLIVVFVIRPDGYCRRCGPLL